MTLTIEPAEYIFVKRRVYHLTGVDLECYKTPQVQRRLRTYLLRSGHANWPTFFRAIAGDEAALSKFKDYLTINVSSFFRDVDKFEYLQETILPLLMDGYRRRLRVWSAGCSHGHEAYSLAILLAEATGLYRQHQILATDIDQSALEHARAGGPYRADEVENIPPTLLSRYFKVDETGYYLTRAIRQRITFSQHNLLADSFEGEFDLIVCRNVVIYFTAEVKARLYRQFHQALCPGGVLFVGSTEVVPGANNLGLDTVGISFYRRQGE